MLLDCTFSRKPMTLYQLLNDTWKCKFLFYSNDFGFNEISQSFCLCVLFISLQNVLRRQTCQTDIFRSIYLLHWRSNVWFILFNKFNDDSRHHCRYHWCKYVRIESDNYHLFFKYYGLQQHFCCLYILEFILTYLNGSPDIHSISVIHLFSFFNSHLFWIVEYN